MTDASSAEWAGVIIIFAFMSGYSFGLGGLTTQALLRLESRGKRSSYEKWGVHKELFQPNSIIVLIGFGILALVFTTFACYVAFQATEPITGDTTSNADGLMYTLFAAGSAAIVGFVMESQRVKHIKAKTRTLDGLREVFHLRFSPSELLSMYEALRSAPPLFWEEYAGLPDNQVSEETNRSFRERAAPYGQSSISRYNRIVIVVAVITSVLTAIVAGNEILL